VASRIPPLGYWHIAAATASLPAGVGTLTADHQMALPQMAAKH